METMKIGQVLVDVTWRSIRRITVLENNDKPIPIQEIIQLLEGDWIEINDWGETERTLSTGMGITEVISLLFSRDRKMLKIAILKKINVPYAVGHQPQGLQISDDISIDTPPKEPFLVGNLEFRLFQKKNGTYLSAPKAKNASSTILLARLKKELENRKKKKPRKR